MTVTIEVLTRRIQPGSDLEELVMIQELRPCQCQYCGMNEHWFDVSEMSRDEAEKIVNAHNRALERI